MSSVTGPSYTISTGASGIFGDLYETKLLRFVLFKLMQDERVEYFNLASDIDDIGYFDDLCLKVKLKGTDRPVFVFIQVKYKEDDDSFIDLDDIFDFDSKSEQDRTDIKRKDLAFWIAARCNGLQNHMLDFPICNEWQSLREFENNTTNVVEINNEKKTFVQDSYLKVQQKFNSNGKDKVFDGNFEANECIFIFYTNARVKPHSLDLDVQFDSAYASIINDILPVSKNGTYLDCTDKVIVSSTNLSSDSSEMARENLHHFFIYAQQDNIMELDERMKCTVDDYCCNTSQAVHYRSEDINLRYHDEVQRWWMNNREIYLTKETRMYQDTMIV